MNNEKNYVLITGASSGIGYELAKIFAGHHYNLILVSRNQTELETRAAEVRESDIDVKILVKDLFSRDETASIYPEIKALGLQVDILVNDAGQGLYGEFKDTEIDRELKIIDLNIASLIILTKDFLKDMISRKSGKILNLASIASETPGPWQSVYHGTKAFVLSFSEAIREELKDSGVSVTALLPGVTDTDFFNKADMNDSKAIQDKDSMADPAIVAQDGFDALMAGKDKVISGFKNRVQVAISHVMPDTAVAHIMAEQQKPVDRGHN